MSNTPTNTKTTPTIVDIDEFDYVSNGVEIINTNFDNVNDYATLTEAGLVQIADEADVLLTDMPLTELESWDDYYVGDYAITPALLQKRLDSTLNIVPQTTDTYTLGTVDKVYEEVHTNNVAFGTNTLTTVDDNLYYNGQQILYAAVSGGGDMLIDTYDPNGVDADCFDMENMVESPNFKILTEAERTIISNVGSLVSNATHTGDVTGSGALTLQPVAITGKPLKETPVADDEVLIADSEAGGALKRVKRSEFAGGGSSEVTLLSTTSTSSYAGYFNNDIVTNVVEDNVNAYESSTKDVKFSTDGTKMYVTGTSGDDINQFNLSVAWDITTAVYSTVFDFTATYVGRPQSLFFKADGTKLYVVCEVLDTISEWDLSSAWDISTLSYVGSFSVGTQETSPTGVQFSTDGTKMYVTGTTGDDLNQYNLGVAWDVTSAVYSTVFDFTATYAPQPYGIHFSSDGLFLYVLDAFLVVNRWSLSVAWDITTLSFTDVNNNEIELDTANIEYLGEGTDHDAGALIRGMAFSTDMSKMYVVSVGSNDTVLAYDIINTVNDMTVGDTYLIDANGVLPVGVEGDIINITTVGDTTKIITTSGSDTFSDTTTILKLDASDITAQLHFNNNNWRVIV